MVAVTLLGFAANGFDERSVFFCVWLLATGADPNGRLDWNTSNYFDKWTPRGVEW